MGCHSMGDGDHHPQSPEPAPDTQTPPQFLNKVMQDMGTVIKFPLSTKETPPEMINDEKIFTVMEYEYSSTGEEEGPKVSLTMNVPNFFTHLLDKQDDIDGLDGAIRNFYNGVQPPFEAVMAKKDNRALAVSHLSLTAIGKINNDMGQRRNNQVHHGHNS